MGEGVESCSKPGFLPANLSYAKDLQYLYLIRGNGNNRKTIKHIIVT